MIQDQGFTAVQVFKDGGQQFETQHALVTKHIVLRKGAQVTAKAAQGNVIGQDGRSTDQGWQRRGSQRKHGGNGKDSMRILEGFRQTSSGGTKKQEGKQDVGMDLVLLVGWFDSFGVVIVGRESERYCTTEEAQTSKCD